MKSRIIILFILCFGAWVIMLLKTAQLQILPNQKLAELESRQFRKIVNLQSRRGAIVDRHQQELAVSVPSYSLFADPKIIKDKRGVAKKLGRYFAKPWNDFFKKIKDGDRRFVWLERHLGEKQKETIQSWKIRGLGFVEEPKRIYPNGRLLSQTLGFLGSEGHGLEGLELKYNEQLQGLNKKLAVRKDARGRPLLLDGRLFTDHPDGSSLQLTIDREIQFKLENELRAAVERHSASSAVGVVLDAATSQILAIANIPDYDLNRPLHFVPDHRRNRVLTDAFEPGSTLKSILIAGALESSIVKPNTFINCEKGEFRIGRHVIHEADSRHRFDKLTVSEVLAHSSNIGTTKIAFLLGDKRVREIYQRFGFGQPTGVDLPGEVAGVLHDLPWRDIKLSNASFGHGLTVTPLQMAAAYAALASDGVLRRPYIVKSILNPDTGDKVEFSPQEVRRVVSPEVAATMRLMLTGATAANASGEKARIPGFLVAGKTGTAQKANPNARGYLKGSYISSFAGFVPANQPKFVIFVAVDNPKDQFYGSQVAAPLFARIASYAVRQEGLSPTVLSADNIIDRTKTTSRRKQEQALKKVSLPTVQNQTPDLIGLSLREVYQKLRGTDLKVQVTGSGRVVRTWPETGDPIPPQKVLRLTLGDSATSLQ